MRAPCRQLHVPHIGAAALRLLFAVLDPRRKRHGRLLFQRPTLGSVRGHAWVPRPWWARLGAIFARCRSHTLRVHRGRRWRRLLVQRWNVGLAWGVFARPTVLAVFKKKSSSKKRRRRQAPGATPSLSLRVQQIKDTKAGLRRRTSLYYDPQLEAQLRSVI